jgi:copper(I)-binding protein
MKILKLLPAISVVIFLVAGCAGASTAQASRITVKEAWSRPMAGVATTPGVIYMAIENAGGADKLLKVQTDVAQMSSVHETKNENGMVEMNEVKDGLEIPANSTVTLKPAGLHIMMMEMQRELKAGDTFDVVLSFQSAGNITATVTVRDM